MIIDCPSCAATYNVSDAKVRGRRVRVRCKHCSTAIIIDGRDLPPEDTLEDRELAPEDATRPLTPDDLTKQYQPTYKSFGSFDSEDEATRVMMAPSATSPQPDKWLVNLSDTDQQTMTTEAIADAYHAGLLPEDAYVWKEGMTRWLPAKEVPEIQKWLEADEATRVFAPPEPSRPIPPPEPSRPPPEPSRPIPPPPALRTPSPRSPAPPPKPAVEYSPPSAPPRAARVAPSRSRGGTDLFGNVELAGSEDELLSSQSAGVLRQPDGRQATGARNESSVLFSLNTLKAGARSGHDSSLPPRPIAAAPQTAADILGLSTQAPPPAALSNEAELLTAPPSVQPRVSEPAARAKMDTTPPAARRGLNTWVLVLSGLFGAVAVFAAVWFVAGRSVSSVSEREEASPAIPASTSTTNEPTIRGATRPLLEEPTAATDDEEEKAAEQTIAAEEPAAAKARPPEPKVVEPPKTSHDVAPSYQPLPQQSAGEEEKETVSPPPAPAPDLASKLAGQKPERATEETSSTPPIPKVVLEEEPTGEATAEEAEKKSPAEAVKPPFDTGAARTALSTAAASAASCKTPDGPTGTGKIQVTFASSGRATTANVVSGPFVGTAVGGCVARIFRQASVPPFSGDSVSVAKSFTIP